MRISDWSSDVCSSDLDLLLAAYPALADQPWLVIPHGHYQGRVATPPSLPRVYPAGPVHLAFIGRVKRYKAPDLLASTVQDLPPSTARLVIAGYCTDADLTARSEEHTSELQSLMRISYAVFCLQKK